MYNIISTTFLDDFFTAYSKRTNKGAYLLRSFSYGKDIEIFLQKLIQNRSKYNVLLICLSSISFYKI